MRLCQYLTTLLFLIGAGHSYAQDSLKLKGVVMEKDEKGDINPLIGAQVFWLNTAIGTSTDTNGVFYISRSSTSSNLIIAYVGFKTDTIAVRNQQNLQVILISKNKLKGVDIVYRRTGTEISYMDPWKTTIMNEKELVKQACCNLAESFETNPSVDVAFSDAITGTRQIQMLGLASQYTQVTQENVPSVRGLAANYGFTYTPGTWVNSIQVSKGVGSVVNGFESITGLINTELHKSDVKDKLYFNAYAGQGGRLEANLIIAEKVNPQYSHSLLTHVSGLVSRMDNNKDGFLDNPLGMQVNVMYRWKWDLAKKGYLIQGGVRALSDKRMGGMLNFNGTLNTDPSKPMYGSEVNTGRLEGWAKMGYVFPRKVYKSAGIQIAYTRQTIDSYFGLNAYDGTQNSVYTNFIYQSIIGSTDHKFRTGWSNQIDNMNEHFVNFGARSFQRVEIVSGGFFEYTYSHSEYFQLVLGVRADYNSLFEFFTTPRLHMRWAPSRNSVWRLSAGRGQRTANILAENMGLMASSRRFVFNQDSGRYAYGFQPEVAWNYGINYTRTFKFNYRPGTFTVDYYNNAFDQQVVVNRDADPRYVDFAKLRGRSISESFQIQVDYEVIKRLDLRVAYRYYDIKTDYPSGFLQIPFVAKNRAFFNMAYETRSKWSFDATWNFNGPKRIPATSMNPADKQLSSYSPSFSTVNAQVTKSFKVKRIDVYVGVENLLNFMQFNPIIDAKNPYSTYFDASMVWGPLFGRMIYTGIRWKI